MVSRYGHENKEFYEQLKNETMWKTYDRMELLGVESLNKLSEIDFVTTIVSYIPKILKVKSSHVWVYDIINWIITQLQYNG